MLNNCATHLAAICKTTIHPNIHKPGRLCVCVLTLCCANANGVRCGLLWCAVGWDASQVSAATACCEVPGSAAAAAGVRLSTAHATAHAHSRRLNNTRLPCPRTVRPAGRRSRRLSDTHRVRHETRDRQLVYTLQS